MPKSINDALKFIGTQWSNINDNKIKGVIAESKLKQYLESHSDKYESILSGGWIITPNKNTIVDTPPHHRIAIIPIYKPFSWGNPSSNKHLLHVHHLDYHYLSQAGIKVYFAQPISSTDCADLDESIFKIPRGASKKPKTKAYKPITYKFRFYTISKSKFIEVPESEVMEYFPKKVRTGTGMRCYNNSLDSTVFPWNDSDIVTELFWKEYIQYYLKNFYCVSFFDMDFFLVSNNRHLYPLEVKTKEVLDTKDRGALFGLDTSNYVLLSYFTFNSTDAIYIILEKDSSGKDIKWLGIKFSDIIKGCYWVTSGGGTSMTGSRSQTVMIPKNLFAPLEDLLLTLK